MMKFKEYNENNPCLYEVLCKMFEIAGISKEVCEEVDGSDQDWYIKHTRTKEQQEEFIDWLANFFYTNTKCRKELTIIGVKNKTLSKKASNLFNFNYGLKLKEK